MQSVCIYIISNIGSLYLTSGSAGMNSETDFNCEIPLEFVSMFFCNKSWSNGILYFWFKDETWKSQHIFSVNFLSFLNSSLQHRQSGTLVYGLTLISLYRCLFRTPVTFLLLKSGISSIITVISCLRVSLLSICASCNVFRSVLPKLLPIWPGTLAQYSCYKDSPLSVYWTSLYIKTALLHGAQLPQSTSIKYFKPFLKPRHTVTILEKTVVIIWLYAIWVGTLCMISKCTKHFSLSFAHDAAKSEIWPPLLRLFAWF